MTSVCTQIHVYMWTILYLSSKHDPEWKRACRLPSAFSFFFLFCVFFVFVFSRLTVCLKGNSAEFIHKGQSPSHGECYSGCENSCTLSSVAPEQLCQAWENKPRFRQGHVNLGHELKRGPLTKDAGSLYYLDIWGSATFIFKLFVFFLSALCKCSSHFKM